jgi:hypothetical protein
MDTLQSYYDEHAAQARNHEGQRERATNLILSIAGLLVGFVTFAKLSLWSLPAAICVVLLGIFGFVFAGKHYERFRYHTQIMEAIRLEIERVSNHHPKITPKSLSDLRSDGEDNHYEVYLAKLSREQKRVAGYCSVVDCSPKTSCLLGVPAPTRRCHRCRSLLSYRPQREIQ